MKNVRKNTERRGDLMDIKFEVKGDFSNVERWLKNIASNTQLYSTLDEIGKAGSVELSRHTPVDTGETANSWHHEIKMGLRKSELSWYNTAHPGVFGSLAVMLHTGYVTGTGGYVPGRQYITTAMDSIYSDASYKLVEAIMNG